jgi:hypothetical protein
LGCMTRRTLSLSTLLIKMWCTLIHFEGRCRKGRENNSIKRHVWWQRVAVCVVRTRSESMLL